MNNIATLLVKKGTHFGWIPLWGLICSFLKLDLNHVRITVKEGPNRSIGYR